MAQQLICSSCRRLAWLEFSASINKRFTMACNSSPWGLTSSSELHRQWTPALVYITILKHVI